MKLLGLVLESMCLLHVRMDFICVFQWYVYYKMYNETKVEPQEKPLLIDISSVVLLAGAD